MEHPLQNPGYADSEVLLRLAGFAKDIKKRLVKLLRIAPGVRVIDVGCGPGTDTVGMAKAVGKEGLVVGIDYDESMICDAMKRARKAGVAAWTQHIVANASAIPHESDFFHSCRSERLFQQIEDSHEVLEEMIRVTKPGGTLAVADADWCSLSIDAPQAHIERRITRFLPDLLKNGYAGRQLFRLFQEHALFDVSVEVHPLVWTDWHLFYSTSFSIADLDRKLIEFGTVTEEELGSFYAELEETNKCGGFFASANMMLVTGVKPG